MKKVIDHRTDKTYPPLVAFETSTKIHLTAGKKGTMRPVHEQILSQQSFMREVSGKAAESLIARAKKVQESIDNGKPEYDMLLTGAFNSWITEFDR